MEQGDGLNAQKARRRVRSATTGMAVPIATLLAAPPARQRGASVGTGAPVALLKQHGRPAPTKGTRMAPFVPRLGPAAAEALPPPPDAIDSIKVVNFVNEDAA